MKRPLILLLGVGLYAAGLAGCDDDSASDPTPDMSVSPDAAPSPDAQPADAGPSPDAQTADAEVDATREVG